MAESTPYSGFPVVLEQEEMWDAVVFFLSFLHDNMKVRDEVKTKLPPPLYEKHCVCNCQQEVVHFWTIVQITHLCEKGCKIPQPGNSSFLVPSSMSFGHKQKDEEGELLDLCRTLSQALPALQHSACTAKSRNQFWTRHDNIKTPSIFARSALEGRLQLQINHIANVKATCHWKLPGKDGESFYLFIYFLRKTSCF